jgi:hypothetical protein
MKAVVGAALRGILAGFAFWVIGELLVNIGVMPSGALALAIVAWAVGANVLLASRIREVFERTRLAGVPWREQRSTYFFQLFVAGAAALVLGLFFEAVVYGLMEYYGVVNPYFVILAFGLSFGSFWLAYAATGGSTEPETQT